MFTTVIFDRSGTLQNNINAFKEVIDKIFMHFGKKPISLDTIKETFILPYMSRRNIYIPEMSKEVQDKMFKDHMLEKGCSACVFPGVYETLHTLHQQGIQLFVLSSDSYETLLPEIEKAGLTGVFTEVYGCAHEKDIILTEIITHYHLDPETTLLVGDTSGEVFAGRKNGVKTAGISRGFQTKKRLEEAKPDYLINTIEEILSIV